MKSLESKYFQANRTKTVFLPYKSIINLNKYASKAKTGRNSVICIKCAIH